MIKDIFEDMKRHNSDNLENNREVWVGNPATGKFEARKWKKVQVGQIVKISQDEFFPADLVLLNSSGPKGICYVETKNLDGETNLKHKQGVKELVEYLEIKGEAQSMVDSNIL
jgi:phospholipid-transporting ATPase